MSDYYGQNPNDPRYRPQSATAGSKYTSHDGYAYSPQILPDTESDRFYGILVTLPNGTTQLVTDTQIALIAESLSINPLRTRDTPP
jgi:hypothetical protein